jgi:uncharacterized membrane protein YccF (DUF307 family)
MSRVILLSVILIVSLPLAYAAYNMKQHLADQTAIHMQKLKQASGS